MQPVSRSRPDEPGWRNLSDPNTGLLVRQSYGANQVECSEWSEVTAGADLADALFAWTGPSRTLDEAVRLNRQRRSTGAGPGLAG